MEEPELTKTILGHILNTEGLLKKLDIDKSFFRDQKQRLIFQELENGNRDIMLIAKNLKKVRGIASYLSSLFDGLARSDAEMTQIYINRVKIDRLRMDISKLVSQGAKSGYFDHDKIHELYMNIKKLETSNHKEELANSVEELAEMEIPQIDWLVYPILEKHGYTIAGGIKGIGKSLLVTQLAFYLAAGKSPFLSEEITIPRPRKVLLIQQEVSLPGMQDRFQKMRMEQMFELQGRLLQRTTTGEQWDLTDPEDLQKLMSLINKYKPEVLILDPLYTFHRKGLNADKDAAPILKITQEIKTNNDLGIIWVHHFSNKEDPDTLRPSIGRFMGSSNIANAADVTIALDYLHPRYKQQVLPLPYHHYVTVEVTTRHGEWPRKFTLERGPDCLLFRKSTIWRDIGKKVVPDQIEELIEANGGEMRQQEIINSLASIAGHTTVRKAINELVREGKVLSEELPEKGKPAILRLIK